MTATLPTTTLKDNSWATVRQASDAGNKADCRAVGGYKPVTINGKVGGKLVGLCDSQYNNEQMSAGCVLLPPPFSPVLSGSKNSAKP